MISSNLGGLRPSATLAINERCNELRRQGRRIFHLGFGQSPFPVPAPIIEALRANAHRNEYLPVKGLGKLREAIAAYHRSRHSIPAAADDVIVGPGSKELIFLVQFVYDAEVLITTPAWVSYGPQAEVLGRRVRLLPARKEHGWRLTAEELEQFCRETPAGRRLLILNYPNNPTGLTYSAAELKFLAEAARTHGVIILADEIYGELHHSGQHVSVAKFYPEGTIVAGGLSKWCGAGGWRLGTLTFPAKLRPMLDAVAAMASLTYTTASAPVQYAAAQAFEFGEEIEDYLDRARKILRALNSLVTARLRAAGVDVCPAQGAFYLFPDFSSHAGRLAAMGVQTSNGLCERLLEDTGVALLPGTDFGRPPEEMTARLAYVDFDGGRVLEAASQPVDDAFLQQHCADVPAAIDLIANWLRR